MKHLKYFVSFTLFSITVNLGFAQVNLVQNPGFELYTVCPTNGGEIFKTFNWVNPTSSSPDYFNSCSTTFISSAVWIPWNSWGFQYAHSGSAYAGIYPFAVNATEIREYIESQLASPLLSNKRYKFNYYVSFANEFGYAVNKMGAYFSSSYISSATMTSFPYTAQVQNSAVNPLTDTLNWMKIEGDFVAAGGEQYITIGNFNSDANSDTVKVNTGGILESCCSYYYIDDVSLILMDSLIRSVTYTNPTSCFATDGSIQIEFNNVPPGGLFDVDADNNGIYEYIGLSFSGFTLTITGLGVGATVNNIRVRCVGTGYVSNLYISNYTFVSAFPEINNVSYINPTCANPYGSATIHFACTPLPAGSYDVDMDNNGSYQYTGIVAQGDSITLPNFVGGNTITNCKVQNTTASFVSNVFNTSHTFTSPSYVITNVGYVNPTRCDSNDGKVYVTFNCNLPNENYNVDMDNNGTYEKTGITNVANLLTLTGYAKGAVFTNCRVQNAAATYTSNIFTTNQTFVEPVNPIINSVTWDAAGMHILLGNYQSNGGNIFSFDAGQDGIFEYDNILISGNELLITNYSGEAITNCIVKQNGTGCESSMFVATQIAPLSFGEGLGVRFIPNPAQNKITLSLTNETEIIESVLILDVSGRVLLKVPIYRDEIDVCELAKGIYFVEVKTKNGTHVGKFIKE